MTRSEARRPEVLTIHEAAAVLRVDWRTVRAEIRGGRLRGRKVGRDWRIPRSGLDEYLAGSDG